MQKQSKNWPGVQYPLKGLKKTRPEINRRIIKERQLKAYEISPDWGAIAPACVLAVLDRGGFSHWHGIRICACLLGHFFAKFGIAIGGFSSETKEPKLHKLGVFWANYCKKHPIWSKLGAFLSKMVYWWVGNLSKNWYRDSQIFEVRQAHPRTILVKEPPPPGYRQLYKCNWCTQGVPVVPLIVSIGGTAWFTDRYSDTSILDWTSDIVDTSSSQEGWQEITSS